MGLAKKQQNRQTRPPKGATPKGSNNGGGRKPADEMFDDPKKVKELYDMSSQCMTVDQIALCLGIARATLYNILDRRPQLREIMQQGRGQAIKDVSKALIADAKRGNTTAQIFFLKAQANWRDRVDVVHSGTVKHEVEIEAVKRIDAMTAEQREARRAELLAQKVLVDSNTIDVEVD